jgi:hypothetical protein
MQHPDDHVSLIAADKDDDDRKCAYAADHEEEEGTEKGEEAASITEDFGKSGFLKNSKKGFTTSSFADP